MLVALLLGAGVGDDRGKWLVGFGVKIGKEIPKQKKKQNYDGSYLLDILVFTPVNLSDILVFTPVEVNRGDLSCQII